MSIISTNASKGVRLGIGFAFPFQSLLSIHQQYVKYKTHLGCVTEVGPNYTFVNQEFSKIVDIEVDRFSENLSNQMVCNFIQ